MFGEGKRDKQVWMKEAEEAFERILAGSGASEPKTFDELEREAVVVGDRLTAWLLEKRVAMQSEQATSGEICCPCCGERSKPKQEERESRELETTRGTVAITRQGFYCGRCRKVFFPGGPAAGPQG